MDDKVNQNVSVYRALKIMSKESIKLKDYYDYIKGEK